MLKYLSRRAVLALIGFLLVSNPSLVSKAESALQGLRAAAQSATPSPIKIEQYRWASCDKTAVEVNVQGMPNSTLKEVAYALKIVEEQSGKKFYISRTTNKVPNKDYYLERVPNGYPPVLIAFVERDKSDIISAKTAIAGAVANPASGNIVTGAVAVDKLAYLSLDNSLTPGMTRVTVLVHELGHILGLKHAEEGIMSTTLNKINTLEFTNTEINNIKPERCAK
ncbi:MAG: matrixin family metalloprotease [Candidatus Paceibacterota bacterium]